MSIKFNLSNISQFQILYNELKIKAFDNLIEFSNQHETLARIAGLPISLCIPLLKIVETIAIVAEASIKGISNIFGAPLSEKCVFSKGVKQIFLQIPLHLILNTITLPLNLSIGILINLIAISVHPQLVFTLTKNQAKTENGMIEDAIENQVYNEPKNPSEHLIFKTQMYLTKKMYA